MLYKKTIVNFLFIVSFPVYGIGSYVSGSISPSLGLIVSSSPYILIILFYAIDLLYKEDIYIKVNRSYYLMLALLLCYAASLFVAISKNLPDFTMGMAGLRVIFLMGLFHAFVIVYLYNSKKSVIPTLAFTGLSLLLLLNIVGYFVLGLSNNTHSIEGRINFPFIGGLYSGASLLAMMNLMLLYYLRINWNKPFTFTALLVYFLTNLLLLFYINSRLVSIIFLLVFVLTLVNVSKKFKGVYVASMGTLPFLLSSGTIIYQILSIPILAVIMQRVDFTDVTTFNGRSFIWESGVDWLLYDQTNLIFGNGYKGHYYIDLLYDVGKVFNFKEVYHLHMHSSSLEILVSQGLVGFTIFVMLLYTLFKYYREKYARSDYEGVYFPVVVFLLFVTHIDTFVYMDNLGGLMCCLLMAGVCIRNERPAFTHPSNHAAQSSFPVCNVEPHLKEQFNGSGNFLRL